MGWKGGPAGSNGTRSKDQRMDVPEYLQLINVKSGAEWTDAENLAVAAWLSEGEQERLVWGCAARYLGTGATKQDIEEVWIDFYKILLSRARESYRPGGPGFATYLLNVCLKNYCVVQGNRIRRRQAREQPIEDLDPRTIVEVADEHSPRLLAERNAFVAALQQALAHPSMPVRQRTAFKLKYLRELSYDQIATEMQAPLGSVKAWVHRAAARIANVLRQQGWLE
jgi:RNA polymerase sigma factor (sigma-70 family)